jgi:hypothetical protein
VTFRRGSFEQAENGIEKNGKMGKKERQKDQDSGIVWGIVRIV